MQSSDSAPDKVNAVGTIIDNNLPDTHFWQGRVEEFAKLREWFDSGTIKLIGVKAAGGFGKSALVAKFSEELTDFTEQSWNVVWTTFSQAYPFAVWGRWLLDKLKQPAPEKDDELIVAVCHALASQKYLLIWDNLETLLQADGSWLDDAYRQFLLSWFNSHSQSIILVTSREQPLLPANTLNQSKWLALDGLTTDAGVALLQDLDISGSDFDLQQFVEYTAGHPLLLKLAAGILHEEEGEEVNITAWKQNIFQILGLHRNDPEASISKILDASIARLRPHLQVFLFRLSVYLLPFDTEAAALMQLNLTPDSEMTLEQVKDELRKLVKRCLLQESKQESNQQRVWIFQFQPLIQDYLQQKISDEEKQIAHQQAITYYEKHRKPQLESTDELEAVSEYLQIFHHYCELKDYLSAFNILQQETNPDERYSNCDSLLQFRGYNAIRLTFYERLLAEWFPQTDDVINLKNILLSLLTTVKQSQIPAVATLHIVTLIVTNLISILFQNLIPFINTIKTYGDVLQFLKRSDEALNRYEDALNYYRQIGAKLGEANTLRAIGDVLQFLDRRDEALNRYEEALNYYRQIGDRLGEANTLKAIGDVLQFLDRRDEALNRYEDALNYYRQIGSKLGEANTLQALGKLQSNPHEVLRYLQQAQNFYIQIQDIYSQSRNLLFIADAQLKNGDKAAAISSLTEASHLANTINFQPLQEYAGSKIAEIQNPSKPNLWLFLRGLLRKRWLMLSLLFLLGLMVVLLLYR
ncbi:MAG: tetratricopeptide repeat protein [Rivularia sp. (in: cyanobacteria)]